MGSSKNYQKEMESVRKDFDFQKFNYGLTFATTLGDIDLEFYPEVAPNHCINMLGLAQLGFYDGIHFHRVVPDFVIQAGCPEGTGTGGPGYTVAAEFNNRAHEAGIVSMARTNDPNSAGSQFFLCLGKVPYLDNKYTVFGKTKDQASLDTVLKIGGVKTDGGDRPVEAVTIKTAKVTKTPKSL
jgi:cyclophilin family peptidyl-prolyl cis-trans isomerase